MHMTTAEIWAKRVEEWQASGETSVAYAEGRGFTAGGLRHWAHRLRVQAEKAKQAAPTSTVKMARVRAIRRPGLPQRPAEPGASGVALLVGGTQIVVSSEFDPGTLVAVLAVLRREGGR